jgi:hypothetical protein
MVAVWTLALGLLYGAANGWIGLQLLVGCVFTCFVVGLVVYAMVGLYVCGIMANSAVDTRQILMAELKRVSPRLFKILAGMVHTINP